jgi:hypothetical protein
MNDKGLAAAAAGFEKRRKRGRLFEFGSIASPSARNARKRK